MEKMVRNLLGVTGILIGASVVGLPLMNTQAAPQTFVCADGTEGVGPLSCRASDEDESNVRLNVDRVISLDAVATGGIVQLAPGTSETGSISATVSSNAPFTVSLSAAQPDLSNADKSHTIPASANVQAGTSAWGMKKITETDGTLANATNYTAITTTPEVFYESASPASKKKLDFEAGVSVDSNTQSGLYSTEVTVTAAVK